MYAAFLAALFDETRRVLFVECLDPFVECLDPFDERRRVTLDELFFLEEDRLFDSMVY
jgi:hypothetical protein